ncbi:MAG TPA: hypothetical protein VGE34_04075 [Candidatus Saccharimonadales bacterium]
MIDSIKNNPIRFAIVTFVIILILIAGFFTVQYIQSRKEIVIEFSNTSEVTLLEYRTLKQVGTVKNSGDKIQISKDVRYKLKYTGKDGYESGEVVVDNQKDKLSISPPYSKKKLASLLTDSVVESAHTTITNKYPHISSQYTIEKGELYHSGEWYSTSLVYKGGYNNISDTLHVILKKTDQGWEVSASPNVSFNKIDSPNIPVDILKEVNNS